MRTFSPEPKANQQTTSAKSTTPSRARFGQSPEVNSILHLQRTIGNQAAQRMLQTHAEKPNAGTTALSPRFGHDFSRISIHSSPTGVIRGKLVINEPRDKYEQEANYVSEQVMRMPEPQRQCACGGTCPKCQTQQLVQEHERLRTKRVGSDDLGQTAAPPIISDVLRSFGQPLDAATRAYFEPRFGHDFSGVRVHTNPRAADSVRSVGALAYTVGPNVVFSAGRYDPSSTAGRQLLAHELTHVRQQAAARPTGPLEVVDNAAAEAEADASPRTVAHRMPVAVQRQPDHSRLLPEARLRPPPAPLLVPPGSIRETYVLPAPPDIQLRTPALGVPTEKHPDVLSGRLQRPTPTIIKPVPRCLPDQPLKWSDFTPGSVGGFGAKTVAPVVEENVQGNMMFRVVMDHAASKVLPKLLAAADRTKNGCATDVAACKQVFRGGGFGDFRRTPPQNCDAAEFTKSTATNAGECESVIGADCDRDAVAEAARLLRHEQGHFDLTCKLVGRADDALAAGRPFATVKQWLNTNNNAQQQQYENDTMNGCVASEQAKWQTAIAGGLKAVPGP